MRALATAMDRVTLEFTYDELVLLYGGLVEATEALSASEFRARVGRPEADAEALRTALRPILHALDDLRRDALT